MKVHNFEFYFKGEKKRIEVKKVSLYSSGLMFLNKERAEALLFDFGKEKKRIIITSIFCNPFLAVWLDEEKKVLQINRIIKWKLAICGKGRYVIEIPLNQRYKRVIAEMLKPK